MLKLGLKCAIDDAGFDDRMKENPDVLEFFLREEDLFGTHYDVLVRRIKEAQAKGIRIVLHQPMRIKGRWMSINKKNCIEEDYLRVTTALMMGLCKKYGLKCVVHFNYGELPSKQAEEAIFATESHYKKTIENACNFMETFDPEGTHIVLENGILGAGCYRKDMVFANLLKETNLPLCMDVSHLAISLNEFEDTPHHVYTEEEIHELNNYVGKTIALLKENIQYYHVVDTKAANRGHDSLSLGDGVIAWEKIKPYILEKDYIYEIGLKDLNRCDEMIASHEFFKKI